MLYIFDWDGTLSDSTAKIIYSIQSASKELGLPICSEDAIKNIIGLGLDEAVNMLYPNVEKIEQYDFRKLYSKYFVESEHLTFNFFDGVLSTLKNLKEKGFILAVATGKSRQGLDNVLKHLDLVDFFHSTKCADETASKPNPLMLNQLLEEFNVQVGQAVMVGDTEWDMTMANAIHMPSIAVTYGAHSKERLLACKPNLCIDSFAHVLHWQF